MQPMLKRNKIMIRTLFALMLLLCNPAFAANELPYYDGPEFTPHWLDSQGLVPDGFHRIPEFSLSNQNGQAVSRETIKDKVYVASFFFSTCPGICPAIRSKLAKVQDAFRDNNNVMILSHSIRPTTDTPEVLQRYAKKNGVVSGKWHLLTGTQQDIYQLAREAYFANEDLGNIKDLNDFLHTENLLLIDSNQHIRGIYNGLSQSSVNNLISDIATLEAIEKER